MGPGAVNPLQVALGRWYRQNLSLTTTCSHPTSMAFDGASVWVGSTGKGMSGSLGAAVSIPADSFSWPPSCIAKDMHVPLESALVAFGRDSVWYAFGLELNTDWACPSRCGWSTSGTLPSPVTAMAYDGVRMWLATQHELLSVLDAPVGGVLSTPTQFSAHELQAARALLVEGRNLWVATDEDLARIAVDAPANVRPTALLLGEIGLRGKPTAMTFDGVYLWVATDRGELLKIRASDGRPGLTLNVGGAPKALLFDGLRIWVANSPLDQVTVLDATTGTTLETFAAGITPTALAFDGMNVWIASKGNDSNWGSLMKR
jgi:hypothetical protein